MTHPIPSHNRLSWHYMALQAGFWAMFAAVCAYQAALLAGRGFTSSEIGLVISVRCIAGIFFQPLLGIFADRNPHISLQKIICASLGLSLIAAVLFQFAPMGITGTILAFVVMGGLELSAFPLIDALAVQYINVGVPIKYSLSRGVGSMCYAICCVILGVQADKFGFESTLFVHSALIIVVMILAATYPVYHRESASKDTSPHSPWYLLKSNPSFAVMLGAMMLGVCGIMPLSFFLDSILGQHSASSTVLGVGFFLMGAAELPTAFVFRPLYRKFGSSYLLAISMFFCLLRVIGTLFAPSLIFLLCMQPLQMMGYGLFTPTSVFYVNESVPDVDRVQGQTLMMVAGNGLGGVLGSFIGGYMLQLGGVDALLFFCVGSCGFATLLALWAAKIRPERT